MEKLCEHIERLGARYPLGLQLKDGNILVAVKADLMGVVLDGTCLFLKRKEFLSFRMLPGNLVNVPHLKVGTLRLPVDLVFLSRYFDANKDNPYGMMNFFRCLRHGAIPENLTQFPPLHYAKDSESFKQEVASLFDMALPGDMICTFDRSSKVSRLIRKCDNGPWSHVASVDKGKTIIEMTTSGVVKSDFLPRLQANHQVEVALYRPNESIDIDKMQAYLEAALASQRKFNWMGLFTTYLGKRFGLPLNRGITPSDMMYANKFSLMGYA